MRAEEALTELRAIVEAFQALQSKYVQSFGAGDTEPDGVFQGMLWGAYTEGFQRYVPVDAEGWMLCGDEDEAGAEQAATELSAVLDKACELICGHVNTLGRPVSSEYEAFLEKTCWRCMYGRKQVNA